MDETEQVNIKHTTPLLGPTKRWNCSPLIFVYIFSLVTMISAIAIIIWWACHAGNNEISVEIITREMWNLENVPSNATMHLQVNPPTHAIIIDTATSECFNQKDCTERVRIIQKIDIYKKNINDIAYNFLVGSDGRVYEGRGWDVAGVYASKFNNRSLGIAVIGDYENQEPSGRVLTVTKLIIEESVRRGKLAMNYKLLGHSQVANTGSPGKKLYNIIRTWPHWENCHLGTC